MSSRSKSAAIGERREPRPGVGRASSASPGVELRLSGWRPGLNKVQLTRTLSEGGLGLRRASKLTGELLEGNEVQVHLTQFESVGAAKAALTAIGVENVDAANDL